MKKNIIKYLIFTLLSGVIFMTSCSDPNDYKMFIEGGEISYTGKIDSVLVSSGKERVLIQGLFQSDPKVTKCVIFWNSKMDSLVIPVSRTERTDTLKAIIPLLENLYNFELRTFDNMGNQSIPVYAIGRSYGNIYEKSITNRLIQSAIEDSEVNSVLIKWINIDKTLGAFATEVTYLNTRNEESKVRIDVDEKESVLSNYKIGTNFSYYTLYRPDTLCIDTFITHSSTQKAAAKIDKKNWIATADTYEPTGQLPNGGHPNFVIDDNPNTYWHTVHATHTTPYPHWLAFDFGKKIEVSVVELTSRHDHLNADFRDFLIEGRNSEEEEWALYGSFFLEDIQGPQQFSLTDSPQMRYLRIYQLNGGSPPHSHLAEFSVYGNYLE